MRKGDYIVTHEDSQARERVGAPDVVYPYLRFMADRMGGWVPDTNTAQNSVKAIINHGRWIVECPAKCGGAMIASLQTRLFICPNCRNPENANRFYKVIFPLNFRAIERELLRRPNRRGPLFPGEAENRNWNPGETIADLQRQNQEHGIS